jgi:molecular chaperone GrpE
VFDTQHTQEQADMDQNLTTTTQGGTDAQDTAAEAAETPESPGMSPTDGTQPDAGETASGAADTAAGTETGEAAGEEGAAEAEDVPALQAKVTALAAQLKAKEDEIAEKDKRYVRLQADFENFRRRTATEKADLSKYVTADVVGKFLKILDNFERAEASAETARDIKSVTDGMSAIMKQFHKTLDELGVKEIPAAGEKFDPKYHEAVMRGQNPELEEDTIDTVFEKGYVLDDKVIRHSKVRVITNE